MTLQKSCRPPLLSAISALYPRRTLRLRSPRYGLRPDRPPPRSPHRQTPHSADLLRRLRFWPPPSPHRRILRPLTPLRPLSPLRHWSFLLYRRPRLYRRRG